MFTRYLQKKRNKKMAKAYQKNIEDLKKTYSKVLTR